MIIRATGSRRGRLGSIGLALLDGPGDDLRDGFAGFELDRQGPPIDLELGVKLNQRVAQRAGRCCAGERRNEAIELEQALVLAQAVGLVFDPPPCSRSQFSASMVATRRSTTGSAAAAAGDSASARRLAHVAFTSSE